MLNKALIAITCLLLPVSLSGQAGPVVEKSAAEITCELSGDCDAFNQEMATRDEGEDRAFTLRLPRAGGKPVAGASGANSGYADASDVRGVVKKTTRKREMPPRTATGEVAGSKPGRSSLAIGFASGSDSFTSSGLSQARKLLEAIKPKSAAGKRYLVAGHTDAIGTRERNLELSRRRADALVKFLVDNGVEPVQLEAKGFGLDQPLAGISPRSGANRRVEIVAIN